MEIIECRTAADWEAWLAHHHDRRAEVWLRIAKRASGRASVTSRQALEAALCYGWIDSQRRSNDEATFLQRYSPRSTRSQWSRINVDTAEALVAAGRMREPGLAQIAAARADGRWERAHAPQRGATVPDDLAAALAGRPVARAAFESLDKTRRYAVILRLLRARTPASRAVRLRAAVAGLEPAD